MFVEHHSCLNEYLTPFTCDADPVYPVDVGVDSCCVEEADAIVPPTAGREDVGQSHDQVFFNCLSVRRELSARKIANVQIDSM